MERADLPYDYSFFEIAHCGHPAIPYAHIQLEQARKLLILDLHEEYRPLIYDTLRKKKHNWFACILFTDLRKTHIERI